MPKVIIWRDGAIETEFDPGHRDWRLGRSETNDITLLDPRKSVSRFHAELREENGRWVFINLSSQNGSWKDGQRVNRLVLEHGHEVLFGDYKLSFEDAREVPLPVPPPTPPSADVTANVSADTSKPVAPPEQTLPVGPRGRSLATPAPVPISVAAPVPAPVPVVPATNRPVAPRKGVNPAIIVLLLIALLGALAAGAWKILSSRTVEPRVVQSEARVETPPAGPNDVAPAAPVQDPPAATPPATDPEPTTPATTPPTAESTPPPDVALTPAPDPPPAPGRSVPPPPAPSNAGPPPPQTKRPPAAVAQDNPVVVSRYDAGRRALAAGRFAEAERAFQAVLARQPGFRDTAALLQRARAGQAATREKAMEEAAAFEAKGEWARAIAAYERAGASEEAQAARTKMAEAGDDAYRKARQFDARNRLSEAITWYQRAVMWLPESDARKALAQERLAVLKGGGE